MLTYFKDIGLGIITVLNSMWVACRHFFTPIRHSSVSDGKMDDA